MAPTPTQKHYAAPKPGVPRPPLPINQANPHIKTMDATKPPPVKFQEISREGQATVVGRVKIATPNGHAFILRRLDTGAISVTTMFRAAFPTASEDAEKGETNWIKLSFDISGANKSGKARFAGTWVTPDVALYLADSYSLGHIIPSLAAAVPDPTTTFRRAKGQQLPTPTASPAVEPGPAPAKRRREASPTSPIPATTAPPPAPADTPVSPSQSRKATSPTPRRSTRLRSPTAAAIPPTQPFVVPTPTPKTPRSRRAAREEITTPAGSDETAVDEDAEAVAKVAAPNMHEDIKNQRALIADLQAERDAAQEKAHQEANEELDSAPTPSQQQTEQELMETDETKALKRPRDDESVGYKFNFKIKEPGEGEGEGEGDGEVVERAIATNNRVRMLGAERKSLAWGALAFAAGLGAITFLPTIQSMIF